MLKTNINKFDQFVLAIKAKKLESKIDYEMAINSGTCQLVLDKYYRYKTLCDVLYLASNFTENNIDIEND